MPSTTKPIKLIQFTDCHLFSSPTAKMFGANTFNTLASVLSTASSDLSSADAILITGDLVHDEIPAYQHYRTFFKEQLGKKPILVVPGNHDFDPPVMQDALGSAFQVCGYRDLENWRIVLVDTRIPGEPMGRVGEAQLKRIEEAIKEAEGKGMYVLVAEHHPPMDLSSPWLDQMGLENSYDWLNLLAKYENVKGLVFGHAHQHFEATTKQGMKIMGTPSTSVQFEPRTDKFGVDKQGPGYRVVELGSDGTVQSRVVRVPIGTGQASSASL